MSTFGSTTEDVDGVPIDRGPPEENRMTEAELHNSMRTIASAKATMGELSTLEGLKTEMVVLRDMVDTMTEQHNKMIGLVQTMQNQFDQFQKQRAIELQSWLADGGSTTPEDVLDESVS